MEPPREKVFVRKYGCDCISIYRIIIYKFVKEIGCGLKKEKTRIKFSFVKGPVDFHNTWTL